MEMQFLENLAGIFENAEITDLGFALQKDIPSWPTHPHYMLLPWEEKRLGAVSNHYNKLHGPKDRSMQLIVGRRQNN